MSELTAGQIKGKRNLYLYASTVGLLVLGLIYAWSIFSGPLATHTGYTRGDLQITFTLSMTFFCLGALAGSFLNKVLSVRNTLLIAAVLLAVGFAGTALFATSHIAVIYVCYGILCATSCGIGYNTIIATVGLWFPDKTGFASGVMMMGFGLGSLILGSVASALIATIGIKATFCILAIVGFVVTFVIASLIRTAPSNIVKEMAPHKLSAGSSEKPVIKAGYVYSAPIFWVYCVFVLAAICVGLTLIGSAKSGAEAVGVSSSFATLFVGLVSTMNGVSRVIVGTIYDRTNLKVALFVVSIAGVLAAIGVTVAYSASLPILYIVSGLAIGFSYGGLPPLTAAFAREGFGAKHYPTNLAIVNLNIALAAFLSQGLISFTSPDGTATHPSVWIGVVVVSVVALLAVAAFSMIYRKS